MQRRGKKKPKEKRKGFLKQNTNKQVVPGVEHEAGKGKDAGTNCLVRHTQTGVCEHGVFYPHSQLKML